LFSKANGTHHPQRIKTADLSKGTCISKLILHPDLNIMIASFRNVKTTKLQVKITQRKLLSMLAGPCS
jgi:hypothetical protein